MVATSATNMAAPAASAEKGFFDGKSDLYEGHKVVAMPTSAFGGMTVRDVVSSRNTDYTPSKSPARRRSRSIGRSPASRSRDIVQDVYNRIGVNYIRGRPSIENLLDDSPIVTLPQSGNQEASRPISRGRSVTRGNDTGESRGRSEQIVDDAGRSRSKSRGRVAARWPPENSAMGGASNSQVPNGSFNHSAPSDFPTLGASPQMKERSNYAAQRRSTPQPLNPTFGLRSVQSEKKKRQSFPETRDEQAEEDGANQEERRDTGHVKDRICSYVPAAKNTVPSGRSNIRRSYNNQFNKRDHPPKVDIYGNSNGSTDIQGERDAIASAAGSVDASDTVGQHSVNDARKRYSSANSVSHRSVRSGIADAFLAAISPNKAPSSPVVSKNIPIVEIPSDELNVHVDAASLAASSVSGEDFNLSPRKKVGKSFGGVGKLPGYGNTSGLSGEKLEKYIENRVHVQVASMAKSIEARFEHEYKSRIEELERQTDRLHTMVAKLM